MADPEEGGEEAEVVVGDKPITNAADEKAVKARRITLARLERETETYLRTTLASRFGRRMLWGILDGLHPFSTIYGASPTGFPDSMATAAHMAVQQHGLGLFLKWQQIDPEGTRMMLLENDPRFADKK